MLPRNSCQNSPHHPAQGSPVSSTSTAGPAQPPPHLHRFPLPSVWLLSPQLLPGTLCSDAPFLQTFSSRFLLHSTPPLFSAPPSSRSTSSSLRSGGPLPHSEGCGTVAATSIQAVSVHSPAGRRGSAQSLPTSPVATHDRLVTDPPHTHTLSLLTQHLSF